MRRDWAAARAKVAREGMCRVRLGRAYGGCEGPVQAAHVIGRATDRKNANGVAVVVAEAVVPLCLSHHQKYDTHQLDLLPYLTLPEQVYAVEAAGGIEAARRRTTGGAD